MKSLYVIGGQQRAARTLLEGDGRWEEYSKGLILEVYPQTGEVELRVEYESPSDVRGPDDPILFKSGTLKGDTLYVSTLTEALTYRLPHFELLDRISLPCFNDVHHVVPTAHDTLLIANSGLEMVIEITPGGEVVKEWNTLGEAPWQHFSKDIDYRKGISTKPHRSHPNYVFLNGSDIWATRFHQKDAINLSQPGQRIELGGERVHDGVVHNGHIYFTSVDGKLIIANRETLKVDEVVDLNSMYEGDVRLGWTRSILFDNDLVWIGFSRIRPTKFRENVGFVVRGFKHDLPTRIACFDLAARRCVNQIDLEPNGLSAVFGIFHAPAGAALQ